MWPYKVVKDVILLIKPKEELPFIISPILLHHKMSSCQLNNHDTTQMNI